MDMTSKVTWLWYGYDQQSNMVMVWTWPANKLREMSQTGTVIW